MGFGTCQSSRAFSLLGNCSQERQWRRGCLPAPPPPLQDPVPVVRGGLPVAVRCPQALRADLWWDSGGYTPQRARALPGGLLQPLSHFCYLPLVNKGGGNILNCKQSVKSSSCKQRLKMLSILTCKQSNKMQKFPVPGIRQSNKTEFCAQGPNSPVSQRKGVGAGGSRSLSRCGPGAPVNMGVAPTLGIVSPLVLIPGCPSHPALGMSPGGHQTALLTAGRAPPAGGDARPAALWEEGPGSGTSSSPRS